MQRDAVGVGCEHVVDVFAQEQPRNAESKADGSAADNVDGSVHAEINAAVADAGAPNEGERSERGQRRGIEALGVKQHVAEHAHAVQAVRGGEPKLFGVVIGDAQALHTCSRDKWGQTARGGWSTGLPWGRSVHMTSLRELPMYLRQESA